ncbi:hypothetical protein [Portibacter lacus]|uniref:Uncharacterized protein n=1 Tax=Portibacter lacus TaxID=1099794 RepID=A0AA37SRP6_9BACT|nr:hypothetical protein [Portibacter lacus]GLR18610.1 hypothetical protein GCM10007940_32260 [Portibacter lacus]
MTATLISLISISTGIIGAYFFGSIYKRFSMGFIGNTIAGVFGSIFLIKSFGRLGFGPGNIVGVDQIHYSLLVINLLLSMLGGAIAVLGISSLRNRMAKERI